MLIDPSAIGVEVWKGSAAAWECDMMGHLNIRFYNARLVEGLVAMAAELGMPGAFGRGAAATLLVRDQHIRFMKEAGPGAPLAMTGGVLEIGESDARLSFLLWHASGELAAAFQLVVAQVAVGDESPIAWPSHVRLRAEELRVEIPAGAGPRSLAMQGVASIASTGRADALGLPVCARKAVLTEDCDAFGRLRTELMIGLIASGMPHLLDGRRPLVHDGHRVGGAVLEYRLIYCAWPTVGDLIVLRSGYVDGDDRFRRMIHWLLDPQSGRPWCVAEAIGVTLDLDARKIIRLSGEALAAADAQLIPGLSL